MSGTDLVAVPGQASPTVSEPDRIPPGLPAALPPQPAMVAPHRHWLKIILVTASALAIVGYLSRNLLFGQPVEAYAVTQGELTQTLVASGRVITPQRVAIAAETTARVNRIPVIEGQTVTRGQVLIELDDRNERATVAQAVAAVTQAEARLRQLREVGLPGALQSLRQAQANADQARQQIERLQVLHLKDFAGQSQIDDAQRNLDFTESQVKSARLQVATNRHGGSDSALALAAWAQAQANLSAARVKLAHDTIVAPADGTLISRSVEPGDIAEPGKVLLALAVNGDTQIQLQVDEKNLGKLAVGQQALASADAFLSESFDAVVVYINPGIDPQRGSVEVKLKVLDPPAYLRQDMTVSVDIQTAQRRDVIAISSGAIHDLSGKAPWVLVVRGRRAERQPVTLGLLGDNRVEVLSGLTAGEAVIPASTATITAGQRVRATLLAAP